MRKFFLTMIAFLASCSVEQEQEKMVVTQRSDVVDSFPVRDFANECQEQEQNQNPGPHVWIEENVGFFVSGEIVDVRFDYETVVTGHARGIYTGACSLIVPAIEFDIRVSESFRGELSGVVTARIGGYEMRDWHSHPRIDDGVLSWSEPNVKVVPGQNVVVHLKRLNEHVFVAETPLGVVHDDGRVDWKYDGDCGLKYEVAFTNIMNGNASRELSPSNGTDEALDLIKYSGFCYPFNGQN